MGAQQCGTDGGALIEHGSTMPSTRDQSRLLEYLQMLADGRGASSTIIATFL